MTPLFRSILLKGETMNFRDAMGLNLNEISGTTRKEVMASF